MYIMKKTVNSKVLRLAALGWSLGLSLTLPLQALAIDGLEGQPGLEGADVSTGGADGQEGTAGTEGGYGGWGGKGGDGFQPSAPEDSSSGGGRGGDGGHGGLGTPALSPDADGHNPSDVYIHGPDGGYGGSGGEGGRGGNGGSGNASSGNGPPDDNGGGSGGLYAPGDGGDALGHGGAGGRGGDGGDGGAGLNLGASIIYSNDGAISGGRGGSGGHGGDGGRGGDGGYGVASPAHQGSGGDSRSDGGDGGRGGDGGTGGQGILVTADGVSLSNHGSVTGGDGGAKGNGGRGGDGGSGGDGFDCDSYSDDLYTPGWTGPPPDGGDSHADGGDGGDGGNNGRGGHGVEVLGQSVVLNNTGLFKGGQGSGVSTYGYGRGRGGQSNWGGYPGKTPDGGWNYGQYGEVFGEYGEDGETGQTSRGGSGLRLGGDQGLALNTGTIQGGDCYRNYYDDIFGDGGPGVLIDGDSNRLVNAGDGFISGGMNGDLTIQADAVQVSGDDNTVELRISADDYDDYGFDGRVVSAGNNNVLALGSELGETLEINRKFDLSSIGSQFVGFGGFEKSGPASWTLVGTTVNDKAWTVRGGLLSVGSVDSSGQPDSFAALGDSQVSVLNKGILAIYGQIGTVAERTAEVLVQAGGALYAGVGGYIFGDLRMADASILLAANRDEALTVTGLTDFISNGDNFDVRLTSVPGGVWEQGKTYRLIKTSDTSQLAAFEDIEVSGPLLDYVIGRDEDDPNLLVLTVRETHGYDPGQPGDPCPPSEPCDTGCARPLTPNQSETARGINSLNPSSPVYQGLTGVSKNDFPEVLDQISGEIHSTIAGVLASQGENFLDRLDGRARSRWDGRMSTWKHLWADVGASYTVLHGDYNTAKSILGGTEASVGYDAAWEGGWNGGLALRLNQLDLKLDERASDADMESLMLAAYLGHQFRLDKGHLRVSLGAAVGRHDISTVRRPMGEKLEDNYNAFSQHYSLRAGYRFNVRPGLDVEPSLRFDYGHYRNDGIEESGGNFALHAYGGQNNELFSETLGLTAYSQLSETADMTVGVGWRNRLKNDGGQLDLAFDGSDEFTIRGAPLGRDTAMVSVGLESRLSDNWTASVGYQGNFSSESTGNAGFATLAWTW